MPVSKNQFNLKKNLCRGDILPNEHNVVIVIKWSKTLQAPQQGSYIVLPKLQDHRICPAVNFQRMCSLYAVSVNSPCFSTLFFTVTERLVRQHLKNILQDLKLYPGQMSFHTFRRSGATLAYNLGINMEDIKRHGTWRSEAVQSYIVADPQKATGVSQGMRAFFNNHM